MAETPRVVLDFVGGSEDGTRYEGPMANGYYWQADHGRLGARFRVIPDARFHDQLAVRHLDTFEPHHYEVYEIEERRDEWDHIYIRAQFLGRADKFLVDPPDEGLA